MSKASGGTRTVSSTNAAASRTFAKSAIERANLSGKVSTIDEANKVMDTYKNLYDMPKKEQKAFTDSFAQAVIDTYNNKRKGYVDSMLKKTDKALKENNKVAYDQAMSHYNVMMKLLVEERQITTDKYNEFIKVKK